MMYNEYNWARTFPLNNFQLLVGEKLMMSVLRSKLECISSVFKSDKIVN